MHFVRILIASGMIMLWLCKYTDVMGQNYKNIVALSYGEQQGSDTNIGAAHKREREMSIEWEEK